MIYMTWTHLMHTTFTIVYRSKLVKHKQISRKNMHMYIKHGSLTNVKHIELIHHMIYDTITNSYSKLQSFVTTHVVVVLVNKNASKWRYYINGYCHKPAIQRVYYSQLILEHENRGWGDGDGSPLRQSTRSRLKTKIGFSTFKRKSGFVVSLFDFDLLSIKIFLNWKNDREI